MKLDLIDYKSEYFNIATYLPEMAEKIPFQKAVIFPESRDSKKRVAYTHLTFKQLNDECDRYAHGLYKLGIRKGVRTLLMVRPSLEFIVLTFSLFKLGAVPILIDPGMGKLNLLQSIKTVKPEAFIAVPEAHVVRLLYRNYFKTVKHLVTIGRPLFWGGVSLDSLREKKYKPFPVARTKSLEMAAILFTTGSTGPAKGVVYEHGMFGAQIVLLKDKYKFAQGEVELACFPLFALFDVAFGMTCVIPDMDPTKPAKIDPKKIIEPILNLGVTSAFGSPALWKRVCDYCVKNNIKFDSLKRVIMAGAPVSGSMLKKFQNLLPKDGDTHTAYGATENLPVSSNNGKSIISNDYRLTKKGYGVCVGFPIDILEVKIIKIIDEPIKKWSDKLVLSQGEVGEIVIKGPIVTKQYFNREDYTKLAKIYDNGEIRHRIGDLGYFDKDGKLWYCGRKAHRVVTNKEILFTIQCESLFNNHKKVFRSALIGLGKKGSQIPVIIVEPYKKYYPKENIEIENFKKEILKIAQKNDKTKIIKKVLFHESFPVDIRHNAKIFREKLAVWAKEVL